VYVELYLHYSLCFPDVQTDNFALLIYLIYFKFLYFRLLLLMCSYFFLLFPPPFPSYLNSFLGAVCSTVFPASQEAFLWKKHPKITLPLNFVRICKLLTPQNYLDTLRTPFVTRSV
jgi:hypothetical protein